MWYYPGVPMLKALATAAGFIVAVHGVLSSQRQAAPPPLEASDYAEIETLYGRSLHDVGVADAGASFARSFTSDGELVQSQRAISGHEELAAFALAQRGLRHWITNLPIEPSPDGAVAWPYILQARGTELVSGALYRDRLVKTGDGWRVKKREVFPGTVMPPRDHYPPPSNVDADTFTGRDYAEIKRLLTRYDLGYDNAGGYDGGQLASLSFTSDALFERPGGPTRRGREGVIEQVKQSISRGARTLHHWDSTPIIDVSPTGEISSLNYDLLFYVEESGSPVRVGGSGTLTHQYVRSAEGWLIEYRRYEGRTVVPTIAWPPAGFGLSASAMTPELLARDSGERGGLSDNDHVDIEQLYVRNSIAFDSGAEEGAAFARTFTSDGMLLRGGTTTSGQESLAALAASNVPGLHTWTSNLVVEPTRDGAVGRVYVLTVSGAGADRPIADVGTYDDELVKTREGWRFRKRTYVSDVTASR